MYYIAWKKQWSVPGVAQELHQVPGRRIRTLGFTPQMVRYAPGQNPRGEDTGAKSNDQGIENAHEATAIHNSIWFI